MDSIPIWLQDTTTKAMTRELEDAINLNPTQGNMSALPYFVWKNLLIGSENAISRAWQGIFVLMVIVFIFFALSFTKSSFSYSVKSFSYQKMS